MSAAPSYITALEIQFLSLDASGRPTAVPVAAVGTEPDPPWEPYQDFTLKKFEFATRGLVFRSVNNWRLALLYHETCCERFGGAPAVVSHLGNISEPQSPTLPDDVDERWRANALRDSHEWSYARFTQLLAVLNAKTTLCHDAAMVLHRDSRAKFSASVDIPTLLGEEAVLQGDAKGGVQ